MATITYHKWHTFIDDKGIEHRFNTQLYSIGVYGILDDNSSMQGSFTPQQVKRIEKNLIKEKEKGIIKDFTLGEPITVTDASGFWKKKITIK
jgi:hypothetical protein